MAAAFCLYPLALIRDMSGLNHFSIVSLIAVSYVVILLIVEWYPYYSHYKPPESTFKLAIIDDSILDSAAISFFAYTCHAGLFPVFSEMTSPTRKRMGKVAFRSILVDGTFYFIVAVAGYLSTFDKTL
jgi:amino acid permease